MSKRLIASLLVMSLLTACASSPEVRYYALETSAKQVGEKTSLKVVALGPMTFPEYLKVPQIVTRQSGNRIRQAEFDRWAEPLDRAFSRVLSTSIDDILDSASVITFPYNASVTPEARVIGRVLQFEADETGQAVLDVQWAVGDGDGTNLVPPRRERFTALASDPGNYNEIVNALNQTVEALSQSMAQALTEVL